MNIKTQHSKNLKMQMIQTCSMFSKNLNCFLRKHLTCKRGFRLSVIPASYCQPMLKKNMVSFTEPFDLLQIAHSRSIHIEPIVDENAIVISSKENGFIKLNLENGKVAQSWTASDCRNLNAPAIFDSSSSAYHCVMNGKELFSWRNEDFSLSKASVNLLRTNHPLAKLQSIVKGNIFDILLFDVTGKVFLKSKLENSDEIAQVTCSNESKSRYIWSDVMDSDDASHAFVAVVTEEAQKYYISVLVLKTSDNHFNFVESYKSLINPFSQGCHVISCTLHYKRLVILWSSNTICSYNLLSHGLRDLGSSNNILTGRVLLHTLPPEFKVSGKGLSKARIGCIDCDHLFVISKCVVDDKKQGIISVINSKFGTEQARTTFPLSSGKEAASSKGDVISSARYCNGKFVIALSNSLICIECRIQSSSLSSVLGKLKSPNVVNSERLSSACLMPNSLKRPYKDVEKNAKKIEKHIQNWKFLEKLEDPLQTPTVETVDQELTRFFEKLNANVKKRFHCVEIELAKDESSEPISKKRKRLMEEKHLLIPERFVQTVVKRCLENDDLWSSSILHKLFELRCVSPKLCSDIMTKCFKSKSLDILGKCFKSLKGIYDKDIVSCLQFILSQKLDVENWNGIFKDDTSPDFVKVENKSLLLLFDVLNYPCNEYSMKESLRNLSVDETRELLKILFELVSRQLTDEDVTVKYNKVIDWISMIIDAKFTTIILCSDLCKLIKLIKNAVGSQMKYFEKLQQIEPFLLQINKTYILPKDYKPVGAYSVETVTL